MSTEKEQQSHIAAWTIALMLVPVLYVLSIGPVNYLQAKHKLPRTIMPKLVTFYSPLEWLSRNTSLRGPMEAYVTWWWDLSGKPRRTAVPAP